VLDCSASSPSVVGDVEDSVTCQILTSPSLAPDARMVGCRGQKDKVQTIRLCAESKPHANSNVGVSIGLLSSRRHIHNRRSFPEEAFDNESNIETGTHTSIMSMK
jgi:hypothetical protein